MSARWDIAVKGGTLLTMSAAMDVLENAVVGIKDGRICFAGSGREAGGEAAAARETIDAANCIVMPGLINTHTHSPMVCFRGMADDLPLMTWLERYIFPAEARHVSPQMVFDSALLAAAEMILSGTTTFCDAYFYAEKIAEAAAHAGVRAVVAQGLTDFAFPGSVPGEDIAPAAQRFIELLRPFAPLIKPALFCHAPYTCSPQTLVKVKTIAREAGILFLTHLLETRDEAARIEESYGREPVARLRDLGVLDARTICVHCNWLSTSDIKIFADLGVKVSHNPQSSMKLAAGVAPVARMLADGVVVGLGTDGSASNNRLDLFREMDMAAKIHKAVNLDPTLMNAETVVRMATIEGAKVLGLETIAGSIEVGKQADVIIVDCSKPHLTPMFNPYSHLVYSASGADVKTSIIDGRIVMRDRRLLTVDAEKAMDRVRLLADNISKEA